VKQNSGIADMIWSDCYRCVVRHCVIVKQHNVMLRVWTEHQLKCAHLYIHNHNKVKVKFFHTRYQVLGPDLIPVYRQPAGDFLKSLPLPLRGLSGRPAVTFPTEEHHRPLPRLTKWTTCPGLLQSFVPEKLNPRPIDRKSNTFPLRHNDN